MAHRWFVACVEPREEFSCIAAMKFVGIEAFSPHERFARKDQWKRWQLVAKPRMPGYVFCSLDLPEQGFALHMRHVVCVLPGKGREPLPVRLGEERRVEALREAEAANSLVTLEELLPKKERRRRGPPALWQQYLGAAPESGRESVLGERLRQAVMAWLEPDAQAEAA